MGKRGRRRTHPWLWPALAFVVITLAFFSYELAALSPFAPPRTARTAITRADLHLMSPFGPAFAGAMVAERAGLFAREGLQINVRAGRNADDPISTVTRHANSFGITRADTFLLARAKGARIVAFAAGFIESPAVFYVLRKSNLRTPQDFVGHRVGRRAGDDTATVYDALIAKLGIAQSQISKVAVRDDLSQLLQGDVDVWPGHVGVEDYALDHKKIDYAVIDPSSFGIDLLGTVYFTSEQTIEQHPDLVRRFLAGLLAGWNLVYNNYAISVPIIASFDPQRLSPAYVRFALDRQRADLRPLALRYGEFNEDQWRSLQAVLLEQRRLARTVDLDAAVTYDVLRDVYRKPLTFGE